MSKINIVALGGLNENGKNMYVVQVEKDIFIFDAGLKYDTGTVLGVDYVIPDFNFIRNNIKNIKGVFITHSHEENIGAIPALVQEFPTLPIYVTKYTSLVLNRKFELMGIKKANIKVIESYKKISFGAVSVFPMNVTHSVPDAVGYVINTPDGAIFYTGNYTFDFAMDGAFKSDIGKLAYIGKQNVLCLLGESIYAEKKGHTSPKHRIEGVVQNTLRKNPGRIIFNSYPSELFRIKELLQEIMKTNRKIVIMGKKLQNTIDDAMNNNYIDFDKKRIGDLKNVNDPNVVLLIANDFENPFGHISRIARGQDKYITIDVRDTVMFTEPVFDGTEKLAVDVSNEMAKIGAQVIVLSQKEHLLHHASQEDIKLMVNLMSPKYYMPVAGEYRHQVMNADAAVHGGFNKQNILLKLNGDVVSFIDGELNINAKDTVKVDDVFIDGKSTMDVGELVLRDRDMLGNDGVVIVWVTIDKTTHKLISRPEIATRGFVYVKDNIDLVKELSSLSKDIIVDELEHNEIDYNNIKNRIREKLNRYIYDQTECKPMIITVVM